MGHSGQSHILCLYIFEPSSFVFNISRMYLERDKPGGLPTHRGGLKRHNLSQPAQMSGANNLPNATARQARPGQRAAEVLPECRWGLAQPHAWQAGSLKE